ncbi:MAG: IS66 family transposase [Phycisphaerae bacterium]
MRKTATRSEALDKLLAALQSGVCDEAAARQLYTLGPDAVILALLAAARRISEQDARLALLEARSSVAGVSPATPSGMIPVYAKPNAATTRRRRRKRPGARDGHRGHRRPTPTRIDQRQTHRLKVCPCCGGPLQRCRRTRTRLIEDLPEDLHSVVTEHTIDRDYCPACKKHVEPVVPDALPNATFGHRIISFTSWCHYGLGVTLDQLVDILQFHLQTKLSAGGLVAAWQRLAEILTPWYEQIAEQAKASAYLHADETGWRVQGRTCWLWCFTNHHNCYYLIDRCRGSPVLQRFFGDAFDGILLHDFWTAYESIDVADRQYCLVHLLRELEKVDQHNDSAEWQAFAKTLRRLIHDGIRLRKRPDFSPDKYQSRILRLGRRLDALIAAGVDGPRAPGSTTRAPGSTTARAAARCPLAAEVFADADVRRLCKRLRRTGDHIFTFLDYPDIAFENNFAERQIRPAVILRKNSQSNRSDRGAVTQAALMSIYRTLRLRGHDPLQTIAAALRTQLQTGQLPPLPAAIVADG